MSKGNTRTTGKEQYYTPQMTAQHLVSCILSDWSSLAQKALWLEPAGGTGMFVNAAQSLGLETWSCDIEPLHPKVMQADFLTVDIAQFANRPTIVFGNPPFGRNNSLSIRFFNRAAEFADMIAFVVPRSWRKWSVQNRLSMNFTLVQDIELDMHYENALGEPFHGAGVRTCFQIWKRESRVPVSIPDRGYITKTTPALASVALTVFGRGCGKVQTEFSRLPNTTKMFLSASDEVINALRQIDFSDFYNRTAYIEALSIHEINYCLNNYFDNQNK